MKVDALFFNPFGCALNDGVGKIRPRIDLATDQCAIDFRAAIARDEARLLKFQQVRKKAPDHVNIMSDGLCADPHASC